MLCKRSFHPLLIRCRKDLSLWQGLLDLVCVTIAKRPVAIEICFRGEPTTFAYQVGIEPDSLRENPGWLANTASIQRAISLQQTGFDLCRGDEQYKRHLVRASKAVCRDPRRASGIAVSVVERGPRITIDRCKIG